MKKTAVIGVLHKDGKLLAEKRHMNEKYFPGSIQFPGGVVETYDKDNEEALRREMKEELGVDILSFRKLHDFVYDDGVEGHVYLIDEYNGIPEALEGEAILWVEDEDVLSQRIDKVIFRKANDFLSE